MFLMIRPPRSTVSPSTVDSKDSSQDTSSRSLSVREREV